MSWCRLWLISVLVVWDRRDQAGTVGSNVGWRNSLVFLQLDFQRRGEDLTKCSWSWPGTTDQGVQSPCSAWHCGTNAASVGGRRANLPFLLLMGCNAKKKLSSFLTVAGSVSLQYVENRLMPSLQEPACSWGIPVAEQLRGYPSLWSCGWLRLPVLFQHTLQGAQIFWVFSWFAVNVPCFVHRAPSQL